MQIYVIFLQFSKFFANFLHFSLLFPLYPSLTDSNKVSKHCETENET